MRHGSTAVCLIFLCWLLCTPTSTPTGTLDTAGVHYYLVIPDSWARLSSVVFFYFISTSALLPTHRSWIQYLILLPVLRTWVKNDFLNVWTTIFPSSDLKSFSRLWMQCVCWQSTLYLIYLAPSKIQTLTWATVPTCWDSTVMSTIPKNVFRIYFN